MKKRHVLGFTIYRLNKAKLDHEFVSPQIFIYLVYLLDPWRQFIILSSPFAIELTTRFQSFAASENVRALVESFMPHITLSVSKKKALGSSLF